MTPMQELIERLPKKSCGRCKRWMRKQPDDLTAPEGDCTLVTNPGHWPTGYWPHTLQRDSCGTGFLRARLALASDGEKQ